MSHSAELDPEFAVAFTKRAWLHVNQQDFESALADMDRAIELEPDDADHYSNRGLIG